MKTVFVGLSGGVDSAVSAALLQEQGYEVIGAFIKIWQPEFIECTWREDRLDAMRVCATLQIPYREIDLSEEYKKEVIEKMVADYRRGVTPNPDVLCNRVIKFGSFAGWAFAHGADYIATGHYARTENGCLLRGKDENKDQSYFLYQVDPSILTRSLFPVGARTKKEVRELAVTFDLPNKHKPDSQGLCFVGDVSMKDFLSRFISLKEGDVVDGNGDIVGKHDGAPLFTIGQRHGFRAQSNEIHYVTRIDVERNIVRVSTRKEDAARHELRLREVNWITKPNEGPFKALVQSRYHERPVPATITCGREIKVQFEKPHVVSPGQSLVIYKEEECLGGGMIELQNG